jgi:hypothetical protein
MIVHLLRVFPPIVPLQSKMNPVPPTHHIFYDTHLHTALLCNCFPSGLPTKLHTHFFPSRACYYNTHKLTETQIYSFVTSETVNFSEFCPICSDMKGTNKLETGWHSQQWLHYTVFNSRKEKDIFIFLKYPDCHWDPPSPILSGYSWLFHQRIKWSQQ